MTSEQKLQEMHLLEQNVQNLLMQKQAFQMELSETESALKEIENSSEDVFKIVGQLMIKSEKTKVLDELKNKKKLLDLRIGSIDKQEASLTEKLSEIREDLMKEAKK